MYWKLFLISNSVETVGIRLAGLSESVHPLSSVKSYLCRHDEHTEAVCGYTLTISGLDVVTFATVLTRWVTQLSALLSASVNPLTYLTSRRSSDQGHKQNSHSVTLRVNTCDLVRWTIWTPTVCVKDALREGWPSQWQYTLHLSRAVSRPHEPMHIWRKNLTRPLWKYNRRCALWHSSN